MISLYPQLWGSLLTERPDPRISLLGEMERPLQWRILGVMVPSISDLIIGKVDHD